MERRVFDAEKYGMAICPYCNSYGYIHRDLQRQCCPKCGGFGYIRKRTGEEENKGGCVVGLRH